MKKRTPIIGSIMAATMFMSIAVGTTLALYTSNKSVNVHLISGSLEAELYLTSMVRDELDEDGLWLVDQEVDLTGKTGYEDGKGVDLSVNTEEVFSDILLVPGMTGTATFRVYNTGDVAFNYTVALVNKEADAELDAELEITSPTAAAQVTVDSYSEFQVSYVFTDLGVDNDGVGLNNDAMDQSVSFDISVLCTQVAKPSSQQP